VTKVEAYLADGRERHLEELAKLLAIPSVSALPAHAEDCRACAAWLAGHLRRIGLDSVEFVETGGNPIVWGEWLHASAEAPTVLVYGHYDVQPADPAERWTSPPFEPTVRDGRLYARGASDNKGPLFAYLASLEAVLAVEGSLPCNVKVLVEGEEELAVERLDRFVATGAERLAADLAVVSDVTLYAPGVPGIPLGLRGMAGLELTVRTAERDLHSGLYGGAVPNALHALSALLASLHDPAGRVAVAGFYDRVRPPAEEELASWRRLPVDDGAAGAEAYGEPGFSSLERAWARPALDVHGVWGGFADEGLKTVIPAEAHAKLSCRLVPDQDPEEVLHLLRAHLERHLPAGARLTVDVELAGARPYVVPLARPFVQAGLGALREAYGVEPVLFRMGWSVPVTDILARRLGLESLLLGFGLPGENAHAPDEHFHLENLDAGIRTAVALWRRLAPGGGHA
jgi:acetylornithine deacetylase/succinyl-diaminopimelate desuccinylase-like protein